MLDCVHERPDALPVLGPLGDGAAGVHLLGPGHLGLRAPVNISLLLVLHHDRAGRPQVLLALRKSGGLDAVSDDR